MLRVGIERQFREVRDFSGEARLLRYENIEVTVMDGDHRLTIRRNSRGIAANALVVRPRIQFGGRYHYLDDFDCKAGRGTLKLPGALADAPH